MITPKLCVFKKTNGTIEIRKTVRTLDAQISNIEDKLKCIKSYRLQLSMLGYIIINGQGVESRKPITDIINRQINRHNKLDLDDRNYHNARQLVYSYVSNPEKLDKSSHIYSRFLEASEGKHSGTDKHAVVLYRLFRANKAEALFKRIEQLENL